VDKPIDPSQAGVDKTSIPDPRIPGAELPLPAGVWLKIPKIWLHSLIGSAQNSLTDPSVDEPTITLSKSKLAEYGAGGGMDLLNFRVEAELTNLKERANVCYAVAWDPGRFPSAPLLAQGNLPGSHPVWDRRTEYLPDYPYMRDVGEHELVIAVQLRAVTQTGKILPSGDFNSWTEFPHVGPIMTRKIRIIMEA
jgi:hypothetical protein